MPEEDYDINLEDLNLNFSFSENLRDIPQSPDDITQAIERLNTHLQFTSDFEQKVKLLGQLGSYCRILGLLKEADIHIRKVLNLVKDKKLNKKFEIINRIRLAHIHHWKRDFLSSNKKFNEIIKECEADSNLNEYLDFAYQHAGKNYFDQNKSKKALFFFYKALLIRNKKRDKLLYDSTLFAIKITKQKFYPQMKHTEIASLLNDLDLPPCII